MLASPFIQWWEQDLLSQPRFWKRPVSGPFVRGEIARQSHRNRQRHKTCPSFYWWTSQHAEMPRPRIMAWWRTVAAASFVWKGDEAELKRRTTNCIKFWRSFKNSLPTSGTPQTRAVMTQIMTWNGHGYGKSRCKAGLVKQDLQADLFPMADPLDTYSGNCHQISL